MRIREIFTLEPKKQILAVEGWVRTKRDTKNVCFFELNDGSCLKNFQIVVDKDKTPHLAPELTKIATGASVRAEGELAASPGSGQNSELQAHSLTVLGESPADSYPLQKKRHSFEFLREIAHLRPRTNTFGAVARVRSALAFAIHRFFQENGFLYIHTPIITASDAEGAGEMFQVTTLPLENIPRKDGKIDYEKDFFGKQARLTVSGQLEGETYAAALGKIYTFGPTFRAENSNTTRHLSEFWMVEPEMAFCDIDANMDTAEEFLKYILSYILRRCGEDMDFFNLRIQPGIIDNLKRVIETPFRRITYTEAVEVLQKAPTAFEFPVSWGIDLQSEHEKYLTENVYGGPVIVTGYPRQIKAFYMKLNADEKTVRAMDVLVPRLGEIIGGSQREDRLDILEKRLTDMGLKKEDYWWYLDLRRYGTVPHSGFGLGFDRIVQYVTGMANIRDVIPYPRTAGSAEF
ncbi:MAG: asparagine--tRNA ligase [Spirochaetales bacterium]|jgi:asparaginyl-tRNA synthetase|nr:asparagine--tRNA ligase [Spirochaetales bacterium]